MFTIVSKLYSPLSGGSISGAGGTLLPSWLHSSHFGIVLTSLVGNSSFLLTDTVPTATAMVAPAVHRACLCSTEACLTQAIFFFHKDLLDVQPSGHQSDDQVLRICPS